MRKLIHVSARFNTIAIPLAIVAFTLVSAFDLLGAEISVKSLPTFPEVKDNYLRNITPKLRASNNPAQNVIVQGVSGETLPSVFSDGEPTWGFFAANFFVDAIWELPHLPNNKVRELQSLSLLISRSDPARRDWKGTILVSDDGRTFFPVLGDPFEFRDTAKTLAGYSEIKFVFNESEVRGFRYIALQTQTKMDSHEAPDRCFRAPRIADIIAEIKELEIN